MASRLLRGRNICRYVSSRLPANSVPSSFARGRIPLGARYYSGSENSSELTLVDILFCTSVVFWGYSMKDLDWSGREFEEAAEDTKYMREEVAKMNVELEKQRVKKEALKKLVEDLELAGSKTQVTKSMEELAGSKTQATKSMEVS